MNRPKFIKVADRIWDSVEINKTFETLQNKEKLQLKYPNSSVSSVHCPRGGWFISIRFDNDEDEAEFIVKECV
jgi:hypothetical protein